MWWVALFACTPGGLRRFDADARLLGVLVTPERLVVPVGGDARLTATGLFDDRTSGDLTYQATWSSTDPDVATVSNDLDAEGVLSGRRAGTTSVWADVDGVLSPPVTVTVTEADLDALSVTPTDLAVGVDQRVALEATARWSDGTQSDATSQVRWFVDDADIAVIDGARLVGVAAGKTKVRAAWDDVESAWVPVTVVQSAAPDLHLADLSAWVDGDTVTLSLDVKNTGNAGAGDFWIDAFLDPTREPRPSDLGDAFTLVNWVGQGATKTVTLELRGVDPGTHDLVILLDSGDAIDESDEGDNTWDGTLELAAQDLPDIVIDDFDAVTDGWSVWYWVELSNYGDVPTGPFYLDLYLDRGSAPRAGQDGDYYVDVPSIAAWDTISFEVEVPEACWYCESWAQADSLDEVRESYEDDNVAGPVLVW